jgi:hypothetical protein
MRRLDERQLLTSCLHFSRSIQWLHLLEPRAEQCRYAEPLVLHLHDPDDFAALNSAAATEVPQCPSHIPVSRRQCKDLLLDSYGMGYHLERDSISTHLRYCLLVLLVLPSGVSSRHIYCYQCLALHDAIRDILSRIWTSHRRFQSQRTAGFPPRTVVLHLHRLVLRCSCPVRRTGIVLESLDVLADAFQIPTRGFPCATGSRPGNSMRNSRVGNLPPAARTVL